VVSDRLLKELAIGFSSTDGKSLSKIKKADKVISFFCERFCHQISTIDEITASHIEDLLRYLKLAFPTRVIKEKKVHPWGDLYRSFKRCFDEVIGEEKWPYLQRIRTTTNGHTPYALKMMLVALRAEIDRMRGKMHRWETDATKGRVIQEEDLKEYLHSTRPKLNEEQLKDLALDFELLSFPTKKDLLKKWGLKRHSMLNDWKWHLQTNKKPNKSSKLAALSEAQIEVLQKDLFPTPRLLQKDLCKKYGITRETLMKYIKAFSKGERQRVYIQTLDISREDVVATICHYLPEWPLIGRSRSESIKIKYLCYEALGGILRAEFSNKDEANSFAEIIQGVVRSNGDNKNLAAMNPGEKLIHNFGKGTLIGKHLNKLFPRGIREITELYFPTTYDWTCILLYWCCKTGWNKETIRTVSAFQLAQMTKGNSELAVFSREHVSIKGEKTRSQPEDNPALYVHVSDVEDKYGLYRVLADYFEFSRCLRPYLKGDEVNCILIGVPNANTNTGIRLSMFGPSDSCCDAPFKDTSSVIEFFKRNPIYEDEGESERIEQTDSMRLRTTYESALEYMGIPLMLRSFILGHKTWDTTTSNYGSDIVSSSLQNERIREHLHILSEQAFKGELKRYEQLKKERGVSVAQLFTHMDNDVIVCLNRNKPTWAGHEEWVSGKSCDFFSQCLLCEQSCVTEDTLPYLVRWQWDIEQWKVEADFGDFPAFLYKRYQAVREILEMCNKDEYWQTVLDKAQDRALDENFFVPPIWSAI